MRVLGFAAAAAMLLVASPALAKGPSAWVKCDGLAKPEGVGVTAARILAVSTTMGLFGLPENSRWEPAATGAAGVAACTEAMADPVLENFWARRVSLLRARALHHIEAQDYDAALTDLRATHGLAAGDANEVFYNRSLGLSVQLFEAALLAKRGELEAAEALAIKAADARPYSAELTGLAAGILHLDPVWTPEKDRILTRLVALDPDTRMMRASLRDWGAEPDAAADDWALALKASDEIKRPPQAPNQRDRMLMARAGVALAKAGRAEEARPIAAYLADPSPAPAGAVAGTFADISYERTKRMAPLIEAELLAHEGKFAEADKLLEPVDGIPLNTTTFDLIARLKAGGQTGVFATADAKTLEANERARIRAERIATLDLLRYAKALPLEQAGGSSKYSKQGWGGFSPNGFKDKPLKDGEGRSIEFVGGFSQHAAVEEMMLMRAAQLARAAGKSGFLVRGRDDYKQVLVTTAYGVQTSSMPAGFKTVADVVFVDPAALPEAYAAQKDRVLLADQVWADLTPIYGDGARKKKTD